MWENYSLQRNPFELKAIEIGGIVPPSTFVGREVDRAKLEQSIKTSSHSLNLVVGEKGVGKTSLGTIIGNDLFDEYFIPLSEIDTQHFWSSKDFIEGALTSFLDSSRKIQSYKKISPKYARTCRKIQEKVEPIFFSKQSGMAGQAFGFGLDKSSGFSTTNISYPLLKIKFAEIVDVVIEEGYKGIVLQYNNLDNMDIDTKKLSKMFSDLRDFLISDNVHFLILGNKLMEEGAKYNPKVNECISLSIHIGSIDSATIKKILKKRYEAFKIENRIPTPPITDEVIDMLWLLYNGNIRQIFYSLHHAVINAKDVIGKSETITKDEAERILHTIAIKKIETKIDNRGMEVLKLIIKHEKDMTNTEITKKMKIFAQNTSKYLKQLKDNNFIIQSDRIGRNVYYRAVHEAKWLLLNPEKNKQTDLSPWQKKQSN